MVSPVALFGLVTRQSGTLYAPEAADAVKFTPVIFEPLTVSLALVGENV